ncbi:RNA pyrophosphohydrolase [Helicobacter sp. MIT 05-5294]|uniref:RNA pyrophosphohydrolase n=1 Tax=Helicobacter sp. MIT 05-5294 TaxID=1548150 RepID=UPI00051FC431|nr:RNA pyrophosphohydrolase [Helicobacter sp. MIT 05-5294]TLD86960.1 RNA pyrophosphohydrolase [Helicobacter sp. MIT 05-5294]
MKKETKTYRPNVAAIILSPKYPLTCELLIASRTDIKNAWQFPQGGIDKSETPKEALFRELKEEIGTNKVDIVAEYPEWISYDFPPQVVQKMYPYDGQIQKYFLVRLREQGEIDIDTEKPEFDAYKFVSVNDIFNHITYFKRPVYKQVLEYFKRKGYL